MQFQEPKFEEQLEEWNLFCRREGQGCVPVTRQEVEQHMRKTFVDPHVYGPHGITKAELELIFDYTCDLCEEYIRDELIGRHGWDLATAEAFLCGNHPKANKIRYCKETVQTSIANLKYAAKFESLSKTKESTEPNVAHLIVHKNVSSSNTTSQQSSPIQSKVDNTPISKINQKETPPPRPVAPYESKFVKTINSPSYTQLSQNNPAQIKYQHLNMQSNPNMNASGQDSKSNQNLPINPDFMENAPSTQSNFSNHNSNSNSNLISNMHDHHSNNSPIVPPRSNMSVPVQVAANNPMIASNSMIASNPMIAPNSNLMMSNGQINSHPNLPPRSASNTPPNQYHYNNPSPNTTSSPAHYASPDLPPRSSSMTSVPVNNSYSNPPPDYNMVRSASGQQNCSNPNLPPRFNSISSPPSAQHYYPPPDYNTVANASGQQNYNNPNLPPRSNSITSVPAQQSYNNSHLPPNLPPRSNSTTIAPSQNNYPNPNMSSSNPTLPPIAPSQHNYQNPNVAPHMIASVPGQHHYQNPNLPPNSNVVASNPNLPSRSNSISSAVQSSPNLPPRSNSMTRPPPQSTSTNLNQPRKSNSIASTVPSSAGPTHLQATSQLDSTGNVPAKLISSLPSRLSSTDSTSSSPKTSKSQTASLPDLQKYANSKDMPPCPILSKRGFCDHQTCEYYHSPECVICRSLVVNGNCDVVNCPYQHLNQPSRNLYLNSYKFDSGKDYFEWTKILHTHSLYCPISMKTKKCGKGVDCKVANCPKQHRKLPKGVVPLTATPSTIASSLIPQPDSEIQSDEPPPIPAARLRLNDVTNQIYHINLVKSIMQGGSKAPLNITITKLEEIHNSMLDEQYQRYFQETQSLKKLRPSELYAFHGSTESALLSIAANGFDMSKIKRTKFGHGIYCALDPNVSVEYCSGGNKILLVRLITDGLKWVKDPAYYVVKESASMNPLYIITFDRKH